jgi:hypothetical protein
VSPRSTVAVAILALSATFADPTNSPVRVVTASDPPIAVTHLALQAPSGPLAISISNRTRVAVRYVRFLLAPADCPSSRKPGAAVVEYGDRSAYRESSVTGESSLAPGAGATLVVPSAVWQKLLASQASAGCPADSRPDLILHTVAMCDGTGWRGVSSEADPGPWVPISGQECK